MQPLPLIAPNPPRLSELGNALRRVEASGVFSNNGPEVQALEAELTDALFGGTGACLAVANATLGLMIAIKEAAATNMRPGAMALMPVLTFAATGQAALWAGLTPLIADIDPADWGASAAAEEQLLARHRDRIAVVVPYATFGNAIDLDRYRSYQRRYGVGIVVDAAASLGTLDDEGRGFAAGTPFATVFSMHATKTFAVAEGGVVYSADRDRIARLRAMANFGFTGTRSATLPGINAKLPEVLAVMARAKLAGFDAICDHRAAIEHAYREALSGFTLQQATGRRRASQFMPVLLPDHLVHQRDAIAAAMEQAGIGTGRYFSPHLGQQALFHEAALIEPTPVADRVADAMLSLPVTDAMTVADAHRAADTLVDACRRVDRVPARAAPGLPPIASVVVVGGGPAGTALLTAATKRNLLPAFARDLVMIERDAVIGGGRLGRYAITSDSTAQTFLTAVKDNAHPELAAIADHPAGRAVASYQDALGVPLVEAGPLLRVTGDRLADLTVRHGGHVLTGHEVLGAQRQAGGLWRVRVRRLSDGHEFDQLARHLVIATGGHQPLPRLAQQRVAGASLIELAGDRLVQSDEVLTVGGYDKVADLLSASRAPRIAVIGGSTSALTTTALLLKGRPPLPLGQGGITLLHRRRLRPFYSSVEAAHAEGFTDFGADDICPVSGFVYRLAGFRLEARELVLRMLSIGGRTPDPRVQLHRITGETDPTARDILARADLVVAALGYRPFALALSEHGGGTIPLATEAGQPMVDPHCRVLGADGQPIAGVYGIGLAAGFVPWGALGGEKSFVGQANGLWLWQNDVGLMIVDQVLAAEQRAAA